MINLDGMDRDDLQAFHARYRRASRADALELFSQPRPRCVRAARLLARYAGHRVASIKERERGNVDRAVRMHDTECDQIFYDLPDYAKW